MQYIRPEADGHLTFAESTDFLMIPCCLYGCHNTETTVHEAVSGRKVFCYHGTLDVPPGRNGLSGVQREDACEPASGDHSAASLHRQKSLSVLCFRITSFGVRNAAGHIPSSSLLKRMGTGSRKNCTSTPGIFWLMEHDTLQAGFRRSPA